MYGKSEPGEQINILDKELSLKDDSVYRIIHWTVFIDDQRFIGKGSLLSKEAIRSISSQEEGAKFEIKIVAGSDAFDRVYTSATFVYTKTFAIPEMRFQYH